MKHLGRGAGVQHGDDARGVEGVAARELGLVVGPLADLPLQPLVELCGGCVVVLKVS